jgi:ferredoxin/flavodoxin
MKAEIYYFTGTGNSLVVARDIAGQIEGELIAIPSVIDQGTIQTNTKVIGIVFPVYMWGIPLIVKRFVKKVGNLQGQYIFAIATYGGMPGATINMLDKVIKKCGGKLAAGFTVRMPGNYTPMYGAIDEAKQQQMFGDWHQKMPTIAEYIKTNRQGAKENGKMFTNVIFSGIIYKLSTPYIPKMDKQFRSDEKCNQCGICQKVCPVNNIELTSGKPRWKGRCEQCFACLQWCPETAIQYGKNTTGRKRYHHPEVKISDMINIRSSKQ